MKRLALLLLISCAAPAKQGPPDANPRQAEEDARLAGYLEGYAEAEAKAQKPQPCPVPEEKPAKEPAKPKKWNKERWK